MKVFLSWSGDRSHKVACAFRDWLPSVLQFICPYVSSEDIDKGARWSTDIAQELDQSAYGILLVTKENLHAPWVAFEAGALSKSLEKARVSPFLFDLKRSEVQGPLLQFQSTIRTKSDIAKLLESINKAADEEERLSEQLLTKVFDVWWPQLEEALKTIPESKSQPEKHARSQEVANSNGLLEEVLDLVRAQHRILTNPTDLLPPEYLREVVGAASSTRQRRLSRKYRGIAKFMRDRLERLSLLTESVEQKARPSLTAKELSELKEILHDLKKVDYDMPKIERALAGRDIEEEW